MDTPLSTGKVKIEYSDPFGVFQLIASDLQARLPLKTLNWTSATRPTRSIDSLYVDLVPDDKSAAPNALRRTASGSGPPDTPISPTSSGEFKRQESQPPKRERRHQIPGLRRTPYLKIYLLRCDDSETYKSTARRAVREWIKANSNASQSGSSSSNQENHDAFEYMIIHVVLPDVQNQATWPTKASSSVLEKLRSDFNSSSRNAPDRIVQIPATKNLQVQGVTVSPIPSGPAKDTFLADSTRAWDDLISKMKLLILNSFDSRVKQYEEDIKEKGMQRSLPGWNFCTFFVLKEGLARGFESVGLVDDALMGYDELSVELLSALRDDHTKESRLFREHTQELLIQAEASLQGQEQPSTRPMQKRLSTSILATDNKPYRELILANNISTFDFRSYAFARQTQLMLRLAALSGKALRANSSSVDLTTSRDPVILADICWRAKEFFADMARIIRSDLKASFRAASNASEAELRARHNVTENLIASWTYKGAVDILNKTREAGLPDVAATEVDEDETVLPGFVPMDNLSRPASPLGQPESISLDAAVSPTRSRPMSPAPFRSRAGLSLDTIQAQIAENISYPSGASSLAAERAELYLIARRALASVGERQGWKTTWPTAGDNDVVESELDDVSLDEVPEKTKNGETKSAVEFTASTMAGVLDPGMRAALVGKTAFYQHWEELSLLACLLFEVAKVRKSVYFITADIAAVRVRLGDYSYAAPYLKELGPKYAAGQWHNLEAAVLDMYVFCLKKLNKNEEYVPAALQMIAKSIKSKESAASTRSDSSSRASAPFSNVDLKGVTAASTSLSKPLQVSLDDFFAQVQLHDYIDHAEDRDEYSFDLGLRSRISNSVEIEQVEVRMSSTAEGLSRELLLTSSQSFDCSTATTVIRVSSKIMVPDWYTLDSITLISGKVRFHRIYRNTSPANRVQESDMPLLRYLIWPSTRACLVKASVYEVIQLDQPRSIIFEIIANQNEIVSGKLLIKSATAGLRLHTADAEIVDGEVEITKDKQPSIVPLSAIKAGSMIRVRIPYRVEGDIKEVSVRTEFTYIVGGQTFVYGSNHRLATQLPLGVNVQDVFKKKALFSKFAISTSTDAPIRVLKAKLAENDSFEVSTPFLAGGGMTVYPKQPASLVYRVVRKTKASASNQQQLSLQIDYQCLDEQIILKVSQRLRDDLLGSQFKDHVSLLIPYLEAFLKLYTQEEDLDRTGLIGAIQVPPYSALDWNEVLKTLSKNVSNETAIWLEHWHEQNKIIVLTQDEAALTRHIGIPVEIPSLPVLHTASIQIEKRPMSKPYTVGELIMGELKISHTRTWSAIDSNPKERLSFIYELEGSSESWLIAGQRRGYFIAAEDELKTFPVMLLPLRAGKLMLPVVEIRSAKEDGSDERTACETDYQSLGIAVEVVPGVTGVSLDVVTNPAGGLDGEIKILEVERDKRVFA